MSALDVKQLRGKTGAGFMDCKKALEASSGDLEQAITWLREKGIAKAASRSLRITSEGVIVMVLSDDKLHGIVVELNCETDFVAKNQAFLSFANEVGALACSQKVINLDVLLAMSMESGVSVEESRQALVAKMGENCQIRRVTALGAPQGGMIGHYQHGSRIGVLVAMSQPNEELGRDLAMHIAANKPMAVNAEAVSKEVIEKERAIFLAQAEQTGKPKDIQNRMVEGKVRKFLVEQTLEGQSFVKNPDITVKALLDQHQVVVTGFVAYRMGEEVSGA